MFCSQIKRKKNLENGIKTYKNVWLVLSKKKLVSVKIATIFLINSFWKEIVQFQVQFNVDKNQPSSEFLINNKRSILYLGIFKYWKPHQHVERLKFIWSHSISVTGNRWKICHINCCFPLYNCHSNSINLT